MKRLPTRASDAANMPEAASGALGGLHDLAWQSSTMLCADSAATPAANGGEGLVDHQPPYTTLDAAAPRDDDGGGLDALFAATTWVPASAVLTSLANPAVDSFVAFVTDTDVGFGDDGPALGPAVIVGHLSLATDPGEVTLVDGSGAALAALCASATSGSALTALASSVNAGAGTVNALTTNAGIGLNTAAPPAAEGIVGHPIPHPDEQGSSHSGPAEGSSIVSASSGINISQVTSNADGSITETVTFAGSGIVFNDTFEASVTQAYKNCILSAEQTIASEWTNSVTINEEFTAQAEGQNGDLASNEFSVYGVSYATLKSALTTLASQEPNDPYLQQAVAHLPSADPSGGAGFELALPYARMLGLTSSSENPDDIVTLNTSYNWSYGQDVINTVEHEISEGGMGRIGGLGDQNSFWSVMDLFRYNSSGVPDYSDGRDGQTTYFSYNSGATLSSLSFNNEFNSHGQQVNGGDTADFVQQDVFGTGNPAETNPLSRTDIEVMEALGWNPPAQGPVVTVSNVTLSAGQASVAASSLFTASDPNGDSITTYGFVDSGPGHFVLNGVTEPTSQEIDVMAAQLSHLTYQSALGTIDTLQIRAEDASLWGAWSTFAVTAPPLVIQTDGSTSLTEVANEYFLYNGAGSGPALTYAGAAATAGDEFGPWVPIGAVQTATGYDIAWEIPGANTYGFWSTDSNGNYTGNLTGGLSGTDYALQSMETTFHQDLNGDGTIGLTKTAIQTDTSAFGSTSLTEVANEYFLYNGAGSGPALTYAGAAATAGDEFGSWVPIGAVQTATGYDIAWEIPGANTYGFWSTDSNGNYTGNLTGGLSGTDYALQSMETTFHQDLNGDGTIGLTKTAIQTDTSAFGSTSLTEVANEYFLYNGAGSGPALTYAGAAATAGDEFGSWVPIGAVQTATGYDIAWEIPGANTYGFWSTDSNGNYTGNLTGGLSGTDYALQSMETTFHQDLNGDGTIGLTKTAIQTDTSAFGSTSLTEVANEYFLYNGAGSGPALTYAGAAATAGDEFGSWVPIGAVQTATGYDIAWEIPGANTYGFWSTDSNGNYTGNLTGSLSGTSLTLEQFELTFNQDLNGDGVIGLYAAPGTALQIGQALAGALGAVTIGSGATLELGAADSATVTFQNSTGTTGTLRLDDAPTFSGEIFNFTGNGTLSGSDQIELRDINFSTVHDNYSDGVLTVTDGTDTAALDFNGTHSLANFSLASDGSGGTIVYDPPVPTTQASEPNGYNDTFVFRPNFGNETTNVHPPGIHAIQLDHTSFAQDLAEMAVQDGHAVIAGAINDTAALTYVPVHQHHQSDFLI